MVYKSRLYIQPTSSILSVYDAHKVDAVCSGCPRCVGDVGVAVAALHGHLAGASHSFRRAQLRRSAG